MQTDDVEIDGMEEIFLVPRESLARRDEFLERVHFEDRARLKSAMSNAIKNKNRPTALTIGSPRLQATKRSLGNSASSPTEIMASPCC